MTSRRGFLAGATGIAFCGCGLLDAAHAQEQGNSRRQAVAVNGKRVKTIDVHAHCVFREAAAELGAEAAPRPRPPSGATRRR